MSKEIQTNTRFPGQPHYTGPTTGYFSLLHHAGPLLENSKNVMERIDYIDHEKPFNERVIRKAHIMYLDPLECPAAVKFAPLYADYEAKRAALYADYEAKRAALYADYEAKRAALYADYEAKRDALYADYEAKRAALYADYEAKRDALDADYEAKRDALDAEIVLYLKQHISDFRWNGKEIEFT